LLDMGKVGWGDESKGATVSLKELIRLSREEKKDNNTDGSTASTPGRYIEIYEVHGNLPKRYADRQDDSGDYETRLFIVAFYQKASVDGHTGVILYSAPETESPFKLCQRTTGTFGRALDFGGAEELFDDQLGTNYAEVLKIQMLDSASKTILGATGTNSSIIAQKNNTNSLENNEILDLGDGDLKQIDTFPRNFRLFDNFSQEKDMHAKEMGAAQDPLQGGEPTAGTPFASLQAQIQQGMGLHDYRRGIFAKHIEEIYKDDYIPQIIKKITQGAKWLSELSLEELQYVKECVVRNAVNEEAVRMVLEDGEDATPEKLDAFKQKVTEDFQKKGNKHFLEALKGEFKGLSLVPKVSVAGKSKNLGKAADAYVNLIKFAFANPMGFAQVMQIPGMAKGWNQVAEYAGLDPQDFTGIEQTAQKMQQAAQPQPQLQPSPIQPAQPNYA
jgi:hypothetical protein